MNKYNKPEISVRRSPDFTEIMSKIPTVFIRFGISIILCIIVGILLVLSFIKLPETIEAEAIIYAPNINKTSCVFINENNLHLIKNNQNILIELYAYPSNKYGILKGNLNFTDSISYSNNGYLIPISIEPNKISYKDMKFKQFKGKATIVINSTSILERIFFNM